jgi:hypothetical protein
VSKGHTQTKRERASLRTAHRIDSKSEEKGEKEKERKDGERKQSSEALIGYSNKKERSWNNQIKLFQPNAATETA